MKNPCRFGMAVLVALLALSGPIASASDVGEPKPLALRKIMQDLGKHTQTVTDAISREDWNIVAQTAMLIADHPQPPTLEKVRILTYIGANAGKFRDHDKQTHDAAIDLQQVAQRGDGQAVIAAFAKVQHACLACHQSFRKPFMEHFYEKP